MYIYYYVETDGQVTAIALPILRKVEFKMYIYLSKYDTYDIENNLKNVDCSGHLHLTSSGSCT